MWRTTIDTAFIRNGDKPPCIGCEHYRPVHYAPFDSSYSKCTKFGSKDIHTGEIVYDYATTAREDETRCGLQGKYFKPERNLCLKKANYRLKKGTPYVVFLLLSYFIYKSS